MNFNKEATTKQSEEKKNLSPEILILSAMALSSVFLAQEKQTDAQPANIANPALVIDVVSKEVLPKVMRMNNAPERKIKTRNPPISSLAIFLMPIII